MLIESNDSKVYRVQDENGRGPFKPGFSKHWVEERKDHKNLKPWMEEFPEAYEQISRGLRFCGIGCLTVKQLQRWFTPAEYSTLLKFGYEAVAMEAMVIAYSDTQCVFQRVKPLNEDVEVLSLYSEVVQT